MAITTASKVQRYLALDAYRGFIMLMLVSHGFGFGELKDDPVWGGLARQFDHVPWEGAVFWDLVQPAFMFIVGVAMPFAIAIRLQQGETWASIARHASLRALKLVLLSQVIMSVSKGELHFQLINVLGQIGFTYFLTFWIMQLRWQWQGVAGILLFVLHTALFFLFPGPEGAFSRVGNIGQVIDKAVLGYNYPGLYVTINFLTSTVTTLAGAWTGQLLLSDRSHVRKMRRMADAAVLVFLVSFGLGALIPNVKRIWTATFTFYSAGWVMLMMLAFYYVVEVLGKRQWTFPLVVIGANSILIYCLYIMLHDWLDRAVAVFTGGFAILGPLAPVAQALAVLAVLWYVNYRLYQRRVFIKI
jgi:predicted acyltransferase